MVEDLRESPFDGFSADTPQIVEQMSLFGDSAFPVLPSVEEQRARIEQTPEQESENENEHAAEVKAPAVSLPVDADALFLNISDEDKARIAAQFSENPRSREAVSLIREIYGDLLDIPLPSQKVCR